MRPAHQRRQAEPLATAAREFKDRVGNKGLAFILITQPRDETVALTPSEAASVKGDRVISLFVTEADHLDLQAKPPKAEACL